MQRNRPLKKGKITLIVMLFFITLFSFRIVWLTIQQPTDDFTAQNGMINLSDATFTDHSLFAMDGEWAFYPSEFISPDQPINTAENMIDVPGDWTENLNNGQPIDVYGAGTYQLHVKLPDDDVSSYGLRFMNLAAAGDVYINGELIGSYNEASETPGTKSQTRGPFVEHFHTNRNTLNIVIHVSNFNHPLNGGLSEHVKIGSETAVDNETQYFTTLQIVVSVIYLLHSLYAFIFWFLSGRKQNRVLLYYGLMLVLAGITILIDDETVVQLPLDLNTSANIMLFLMNSTLLTMLLFIKHLFHLNSRVYYFFYSVYALFCIVQALLSYEQFAIIAALIGLYYISIIVFLFVQTIKMVRRGFPDASLVLLFVTSYTSNALWGAGVKFSDVAMPYYPFDFIVSILAIAFILFNRQKRVMQLNREQTRQLQDADWQKDTFLANTSHELRTPLHGILNIAHLLQEDPGHHLPKEHRLYLNTLTQIANQMTFTLNDLLDATRLKEQGLKLYPKRIDLGSVASAVLDMTHLFTDQKDIRLNMNISSSFPSIYADENRVIQILFNLVHNGIKFTNQGSINLEAEVGASGDMALIHITDTGRGIEPEKLESIFDPYEHSSQQFSEGVGLGLSVSRQLVELHGGFIQAKSEVGKGTIITLSLPLADGRAPKIPEEIAATALGTDAIDNSGSLDSWDISIEAAQSVKKQATILIVEDDPVNLKVIEAILARDYQIVRSNHCREALQLIHNRNDWDLIISDVMMPDMSGYEFTRAVRETYSLAELPIILLTARQQQEDIYTGFIAGANDYVTKPVTAVELKARVQALTSLKRSVEAQLRTEAAWLQAQIRPHFLFNTLNTIAALSEIDTDRMVKLLGMLGDYLRKSFEIYNTSDLVAFDDETGLIESYLYIEKERFGDRLRIEWELDDHHAEDVQIPPLSVQPLVENAVRHGVTKKQAGGTLWIRLQNHTNHWTVEVADNGIGMTTDEIDMIQSKHPTSGGSIGFANTDKRLKQHFGEGLNVKSRFGEGTTISFQVPK